MDFFPSEEHRALLIATLRLHNVTDVVIIFDGSGDSGSIDDIVFRCPNPEEVETTEIHWPKNKDAFVSGEWVREQEICKMPLKQVVEAVTYEALDATGLDWYNNEGGYGKLTISLGSEPATVELDVHVRITQTEDYSFSEDGTEDEERGE